MGTAIGTKFATPYACIFMDEVETSFLETQEMKPLVWFPYIDVFFFLKELNRCNSYLKFTYESSKTSISFLDLKVGLLPAKFFFVICFNDSSLKVMKNAFYFISFKNFIISALFVLKIFKFLSWHFGNLEKTAWLER